MSYSVLNFFLSPTPLLPSPPPPCPLSATARHLRYRRAPSQPVARALRFVPRFFMDTWAIRGLFPTSARSCCGLLWFNLLFEPLCVEKVIFRLNSGGFACVPCFVSVLEQKLWRVELGTTTRARVHAGQHGAHSPDRGKIWSSALTHCGPCAPGAEEEGGGRWGETEQGKERGAWRGMASRIPSAKKVSERGIWLAR